MVRKAFIGGINDYLGCPLRGCLFDNATITRLLCQNVGFDERDITIIQDADLPTWDYKDSLKWLKDGAKFGDVLLHSFSGHGSLLPIKDKSGHVEKMHCCVCPHDFDFSPEHAVTDLDFMEIFADVPAGVSLTLMFDSCHSGNLVRGFQCSVDGSGYRVPRTFPMPESIVRQVDIAFTEGVSLLGFDKAVEHIHGVALTGCKWNQTSADAFIAGNYCGAFTAAFEHQLLLPNGAMKPVKALLGEANEWLEDHGYDQDPQTKGDPEHCGKPWLWGDPV